MTFDRLSEIIAFAEGQHRINRARVNFSKEDKVQAIYILQGGTLTACRMSFNFNQKGYKMATILHKRLIDEATHLIYFFTELDDNSRQIKAWYRGDAVKRTSGKNGGLTIEQRAKKLGVDPDLIRGLDLEIKKSISNTSKYMHPTINIMQANMLQKQHIFDYDQSIGNKTFFNEDGFGSEYVLPTLYALLIPFKIIPYIDIDFKKLINYIHEVQNH